VNKTVVHNTQVTISFLHKYLLDSLYRSTQNTRFVVEIQILDFETFGHVCIISNMYHIGKVVYV